MPINIYTNGSSRGNPGKSAYAFVFVTDDGREVERMAGYMPEATSNTAKYVAIVKALELALSKYPTVEFVLHSDNLVVIKQIKGEYKTNASHLKMYLNRINNIKKALKVDFKHTGKENKYINACSKMCTDILNSVEGLEKEVV